MQKQEQNQWPGQQFVLARNGIIHMYDLNLRSHLNLASLNRFILSHKFHFFKSWQLEIDVGGLQNMHQEWKPYHKINDFNNIKT